MRVPFNTHLDLDAGSLEPGCSRVVRRISDMKGMYHDREAAEILIARGDPVVYEVYSVAVPEAAGEIQHCTSVIRPGRVGEEFFMTKGHFHVKRETAEVYVTLRGEGILLMQLEDGTTRALSVSPGSVSYIPPFWAHRSVNTGAGPLVLFAVYPGDAGHDYGAIEERGFAKLVVARGGKPVLADNPRYIG